MRVNITTLGCKSNQYDSAAMEELLKGNDFTLVKPSEPADVFIINTCTVTGKTDYQSRQLVRRAVAKNPDAIVMVTGCYAQVSPHEVAAIEGVDYVLGNPEKGKIIEYIREGKQKVPKTETSNITKETDPELRALGSSNRTRANLKVQDGCNNSCSYCIIPKARGISRSVSTSAILREVDHLIAKGYKEIVFTGIHLGSYGLDLNPATNIANLIRAIDRQEFACRFRLSSLDPDEVSDELIEIMAHSRTVCNHLHLPLQSGDDTILKKMNRRYTTRLFAERVERLVMSIPDIAIGIDVIIGFPGEGEKEFLNTYHLLKDLPLAYMHIFPFSKRQGTLAAEFSNQVDAKTIKKRCEMLRELDNSKRQEFYKRFIGTKALVLVEGSRDRETGLLKGRARNYIPFFIEGDGNLKNKEIEVLGNDFFGKGIKGHVC